MVTQELNSIQWQGKKTPKDFHTWFLWTTEKVKSMPTGKKKRTKWGQILNSFDLQEGIWPLMWPLDYFQAEE